MCNIAGYVGTEAAAPILLEMLRTQEGYAGGYYTGIATLHEGKIYCAKLTGDVRRLIDQTDAASLPGTVGIIHSRSRSGGGDEWAHPFLGGHGGEARIAYVANGSIGCFKSRAEEFNGTAQKLLDGGYELPSRVKIEAKNYNHLRDGTVAHMSDVMCQMILRNTDRGMAEAQAMERAFCEMPSEIVGLLLSATHPDRVFWSRINMPMFVSSAAHGQYLASAPTAFPQDGKSPQLLLPCSSGYVTAYDRRSTPYERPPAAVAPIEDPLRAAARESVEAMLSDGEGHTLSELVGSIKPHFASADCVPSAAVVYELLYFLKKQGRLREEIRRLPGAFAHLDAPKTYFRVT